MNRRFVALLSSVAFALTALAFLPHSAATTDMTGSTLKLARASVPATLPMHQGYYDGEAVHYIVTDASDREHATQITARQKWRVELAPLLRQTPDAALDTVYLFTNGVQGTGLHGFQAEVFTSTPAQPARYAAVRKVIQVSWSEGRQARVLESELAIINAEHVGEIKLVPTDVVLNMPHITWPGGQLAVKADKQLHDFTPYGGAQVLDIDIRAHTVTFVAHRGWGPDGRSIYYIVTDAAPAGPAKMMGVVDAPTVAKTINTPAAVDLYQFANGIKGTGPKGFQAGIAAAAPGDATYSPLWRIWMVSWTDAKQAGLLQTTDDIFTQQSAGLVQVQLARPGNSDHVVNCPFIDPFQTL